MSQRATGVRWLVLALTVLAALVLIFDRATMSIAANQILVDYKFTQVQMGLVFSAFVTGYATFAVPGGWLADRFGVRRVLAISIAASSIFTVMTAVAGHIFLAGVLGTLGSFVVIRLLVGIAEGAGVPCYVRTAAMWAAPHERARAIGLVYGGHALGSATAPLVVSAVMLTLNWQAAFYIAGSVGLVLTPLWYFMVRDRPEQHPWVNGPELERIRGSPVAETAPKNAAGPAPLAAWKAIFGSRDIKLLAVISLVCGYADYLFFSWFFLYLVNVRGLSVARGGLVTSVPFLASAVAAPLGGWISDRLSARFGTTVGRSVFSGIACLIAAGCIFAGAASPSATSAVVFLACGAALAFLIGVIIFATVTGIVRSHVSLATGFILVLGHLGGALSPTVSPIIAQRWGWDAALCVCAAMMLFAALSWFFVKPGHRIVVGETAMATE
jgi:MFS transporter, ACS family, glucarate transporter